MATYNLNAVQLTAELGALKTAGEAINIVTQLFDNNLWPKGAGALFTEIETQGNTAAAPYELTKSGELFLFAGSAGATAYVSDSRGGNILADPGNIDYLGPLHGVRGDTLIGGASSMSLTVDKGNNVLIAGTGANTLIGGTGNDTMYGGGDSSLVAGSGNDVLRGGLLLGAHDTLFGGAGKDVLRSVVGDSSMVAGTGHNTLYGGSGSDTLVGGGHTVIHAGTGNETIYADSSDAAARDTVYSGSGSDLMYGGAGNTVFRAGAGLNTIIGAGGNDTMYGGAHTSMEAGTGNATLHGGYVATAETTMVGGSGNDLMGALLGKNEFYTGSGNDTIWTGAGHDTVYAGATGDATIHGGANASLHIENTTTVVIDTTKGGMTTLTFANGQVLSYGVHIKIV